MSPHHGETPHDQGERQPSHRGQPRQSGQPREFGGAYDSQRGPGGQAGGGPPPTRQRGGGHPGEGARTRPGPFQGTGGRPGMGSQAPPGQAQAPPGQGPQQGPPPGQQGGFQQQPPGTGQGPAAPGPARQSPTGTQQWGGGQQPGPPSTATGAPQSQFGGSRPQQRGAQGGQQFGGTQQFGSAQSGGPGVSGGMQGQFGGPRHGPRLSPVTVEDIITGAPVTVDPDTPVSTVVAEMAAEDVGSVIVVEGGQPRGIVTDRKIAMAVEQYETVAELTAEDLVTGDLVTATTEDSVFDVLRILREEGIRRLPIVDEEGALEGVVALDDIVVLLATEMGNVGETIQNQIERLG